MPHIIIPVIQGTCTVFGTVTLCFRKKKCTFWCNKILKVTFIKRSLRLKV